MAKPKDIESKVEMLLEGFPETRDDDYVLTYRFWIMYCDVKPHTSVFSALLYHEDFGIPGFDTIRRCRQKIQSDRPDLRAEADIEKARLERQKDFITYALEQ